MLAKSRHLFDDATQVTAGGSRWQGRTSPDYWAFVGPFGGITAATILRGLAEHPTRAGEALSLTVNYCAPIAEGDFDLDFRLVKLLQDKRLPRFQREALQRDNDRKRKLIAPS